MLSKNPPLVKSLVTFSRGHGFLENRGVASFDVNLNFNLGKIHKKFFQGDLRQSN